MTLRIRLQNFPLSYIVTVLAVILFAFALTYLEYNFVLQDMIPYREAHTPDVAWLYSYQITIFLPMLIFIAIQPLIQQIYGKTQPKTPLRRPVALAIACLMLGTIILDMSWFLFRTLTPLATDPLANQWIRPTDYTAAFIGQAQIFTLTLPLWYIAFLPPIIAIFVALIISPPTNAQ